MPNGPLRVQWDAPVERFRDLATGRFLAAAVAAPWLRVSGGALRDTLGRFVPWRFAGGDVSREWPTGKGDMVAITRRITVPVEDMPVRPQDMLVGSVSYNVEGVPQPAEHVSLYKGHSYSEIEYEERAANRITGVFRYKGIEIDYLEDVDLIDVLWAITTFYSSGEYLGRDYDIFQELLGG